MVNCEPFSLANPYRMQIAAASRRAMGWSAAGGVGAAKHEFSHTLPTGGIPATTRAAASGAFGP